MAEHTITGIASVLLAIVGLAVIATLISPQSKTASVIGAGGSATEQALCVAMSPVTGQGSCGVPSTNVFSTITYPGLGLGIPAQ